MRQTGRALRVDKDALRSLESRAAKGEPLDAVSLLTCKMLLSWTNEHPGAHWIPEAEANALMAKAQQKVRARARAKKRQAA